jgi:hypothetical protein
MKTFQPLPEIKREPVNLNEVPPNLTWDDAKQLVGFPTTDGKVILGVSGPPGRGYVDGIYFTIAARNESAFHRRIGDEAKAVSS